jgi:hypothetical protein
VDVISYFKFPPQERRVRHRGDVSSAQNMENEEIQSIGVMNVKQNCIWMGDSRAITQISTSNLVVLFMHILYVQHVQLIR